MTPLLAVAVLLLVLVVTLSFIQRRRQRDFSTSSGARASSAGATAVPDGTDPASDPDWPFLDDPVFGTLTFDDEGTWTGELVLGEHSVEVHLRAGRQGPGERHREWARAAQARGDELIREAGVRMVQLLSRRGLALEEQTPSELHLGDDEDGVFEGRLVFEPEHETVDALYVRSTNSWKTIAACVETVAAEAAPEVVVPGRTDPVLGPITYADPDTWNHDEPFTLAGRDAPVVLLAGPAGPGAEHTRWLRALIQRADAVVSESEALTLTTREPGTMRSDLGVLVVVIGPDEVGRFIGGLTHQWGEGDEGRCHVWSRDLWTTLSLDPG